MGCHYRKPIVDFTRHLRKSLFFNEKSENKITKGGTGRQDWPDPDASFQGADRQLRSST